MWQGEAQIFGRNLTKNSCDHPLANIPAFRRPGFFSSDYDPAGDLNDNRESVKRPINHVGFSVADLERSVAFYCDILGFEVVNRWTRSEPYLGELTGSPGAVVHAAILTIGADPLLLELTQYKKVAESHALVPASANPGAAHLGLNVDNVDALYASMREQGVQFVSKPVTPTAGPNAGGRAVLVLDPDGFRIELVQTKHMLDGQKIE
jgi:lactoylglutathione lyase